MANLTNRPVYQKGDKANKNPTRQQRLRWGRIVLLGCLARCHDGFCGRKPHIHHALTGGGARKDHDKVIPLCELHHTGEQGLHTLGRKRFGELYGTETDMLADVESLLNPSPARP